MFELLDAALGEGSILLNQEASTVAECFTFAGNALEVSGRTTAEYTFEMIEVFNELGPYMVIAPNIALAHARPGSNVISTGLSLVTLNKPVEFGSKKFDPVKIVIGLAAVDHDAHIDLMAELSEFFMNVTNVNFLLQADEVGKVRDLFRQAQSVKIIAVCGMGIGSSISLKMNAEKALEALGIKAEVQALDLRKAQNEGHSADIILTTDDLIPLLQELPGKLVEITYVWDLAEIREKLASALGQ